MKKGIIVLLLVVSSIALVLFCMNNIEIQTSDTQPISEYIPEEEMKKEDIRSTIVTLYFQNKETKELQPEARTIDSKELLKEPYNTIVKMLLEGPKKEQYESVINENTKINGISFSNGIVTIDFSKDFIESDIQKNDERNVVDSITKTLKELNEVEYVRILVEGKEDMVINNGKIVLSEKL